ncbi:MAG: serine/threonine protein kinase [Thermoanaerobaculia bacterium]|nr:serine/threonine protein kinase [Thermoanaerobaculia bacterium]
MNHRPEREPPASLPEDPALSYDPRRSQAPSERRNESGPAGGTVEPETILGYLSPRAERSQTELSESESPTLPEGDVASPTTSRGSKDLRLIERIATGGFGEVWNAWQISLQREVAVKLPTTEEVPEAHSRSGPPRLQQFRLEALTAARLEHPNILPVYNLDYDDEGRPLLAMKLVRGRPWSQLIRESRSHPLSDLLAQHLPVLVQVVKAIAFAHSRGVLHRDLKPSQVMVGSFGEVLLMDWGLALSFDRTEVEIPEGARETELPSPATASSPAGTPVFMAPEQTLPTATRVGPWTDIYLLGGTLYYLLTGSPPHAAESSAAAFELASDGHVEAPELRSPGAPIPAELSLLAQSALVPSIEDRLHDLAYFVGEIEAYLDRASRQADSLRLTAKVSTRLRQLGDGYAAHAEALADLERAQGLWPDNPEEAGLRVRVLASYVAAALVQGDLRLARLHFETMEPSADREILRERLNTAEDETRRRHRQRRLALVASSILTALLAVGALFYLNEQSLASERLRNERDSALKERKRAEELADFMITNLWENLVSSERTDLLSPLAQRVHEHYQTRRNEELAPGERLSRARTSAAVGQVLHLQGNKESAIEAYRQALADFDRLDDTAPFDALTWTERSQALLGLGIALADSGRQEDALATNRDVADQARLRLREHPDEDGALEVLLNALDNTAIVRYDQGDLEGAAGLFREARLQGERLVAEGTVLGPGTLAGIVFREAVTLTDLERYDEALALHRRAEAMFAVDVMNHPEKSFLIDSTAFQQGLIAETLVAAGHPEQAIRQVEAVLPEMEERSAADPENFERRYILALAYLQLANARSKVGGDAIAAWQRCVEVTEVATIDSDHLYLLDTRVRALVALDRLEEARPLAEALLTRQWAHRGFLELSRKAGFVLPSEENPGG